MGQWLVFVIGLLVLSPVASAADTYLYTGTGTLESQGWTLFGNAPEGTASVTTQNSGTPADVLEVQSFDSRIQLYSIASGYTEALVSARVRVIDAQHNFADAGLMFSIFGVTAPVSTPDRLSSFYLLPGEVGFMDLGASAQTGADAFHDYAILYLNNKVSLFIDQSFDAILAGTAPAVLERTGPFFHLGNVHFGDQTNDVDVNSHYLLDSIRLHGITPVPEPGTYALLLAGLGILGFAVRARSQKASAIKR